MSILVMASASARRRAFFEMMKLDCVFSAADIDENIEYMPPDKTVETLSRMKALHVLKSFSEDDYIISADTVVAYKGKIFGKPTSREDAYNMLRSLSGSTHEVYTGFTILHGGKIHTESVCTRVHFRTLSDREIYFYIDSFPPYDKAGAYGIQEFAGVFSSGIEGDINNVIGLPLCALETAMNKKYSSSLLDFAKKDNK